jgi:hypothetical protein
MKTSKKNIRHGRVLSETRNDNNDAIILSLSCREEKTTKYGLFNDLMSLIIENIFDRFPNNPEDDINIPFDDGCVMSLDLITNYEGFREDPFWKNCETVSDAMLKLCYLYDEDIILEYYKPLRVAIGRGWYKIFTYNHIDNKLAAAVIIGSTYFKDVDKELEAYKAANLIVKQIALTNPLCFYTYILTPSILNDVRSRAINEARNMRLEEAADEYATQEIKLFMESYVLEEQILKDGEKIISFIIKNRLRLHDNFIRFHLK